MTEKRPYVATDRQMRFIQCPRCGNSTFSNEADYCRMCGMYRYNQCGEVVAVLPPACGRPNPGDARYCEHCGAPTRLTQLGLLMSWEEVVQNCGYIAGGLEPDFSGHDEYEDDFPEDF